MKTTRYILLGLIVCMAQVFSSCSDTLDITEHGSSSFETFYQTDEEADEAITAVYCDMFDLYFYWYFLKNLLSDDMWCGGGGRGDNNELEQLNEYSFDAAHSYVEYAFECYYSTIYLSNVVLEYVPEESDTQKRDRAEAKVFRAFCYIDLISLWGTPPLVDHPLEASEYQQPNGTTEELWSLVETDLQEAIDSDALTEKSSVDDDSNYRITKQFAMALLGKAYVYQEKWSSACTILDELIESGKYALYDGEYEDLLMYTAEHNCESLFELNRVNDTANPYNTGWSMMSLMTGWRADCMNLADDIYDQGWGFGNPQGGLYDAFVEREGEDGYRLTQSMKTLSQLKETGSSIIDGDEAYGNEGIFGWKDRVLADEMITTGWGSSFNNLRVMRYAEVLLLAAEAHVQAGNTSKATQYVNEIRERAQLPDLASVTMDDVMIEKRLELWGECVRFQDMVRWGIAADLLKDQGSETPWCSSNGTVRWEVYNTSNYGFVEGKHELLPIPDVEISLNANIVQNPGW